MRNVCRARTPLQPPPRRSRSPGQAGHSYGFYTVAPDFVGNVEGAKTVADATTQVVIGNTTPPVIIPHISGTLGNNGWYESNVTVTWNVSDPESGIASSSGCNSTTTLTADTAGVTLTCSATNGAGLTSSAPVTMKIDKTPPSITCRTTPSTLWPPNHQMVPVRATVNVNDATSGPAGLVLTSATSSEPGISMTFKGSQLDRQPRTDWFEPIVSGPVPDERSDVAGNTASCSTTVRVPHDQAK